MKANKLMIGDWVSYGGTPIKVENVYEDCINFQHDIPYVQEEFLIEQTEIKPIPLTPEILEHNFERKGRNYVFSTDFYEVEIHEYNDGMYVLTYTSCEMNLPSTQIANICFVHELQHAMRLCGIEMGIVL